ncbi:hypothetical protein A0H76_383 [Hepatospora eriocheir]|uniref:Uncharacterized protein n=1 Tax=Hepatospora eriocheir TaxID=1081669 RepID=A0A1X0QBB5_9MICR|nr:hypothetical protein A0H76_383 [Hepatospora eriocheir]
MLIILLLKDLVFIISTQLEASEVIFRLESVQNLTPNQLYENSLGRNMEEINNNNETEDGYMPMNGSTIITLENDRPMISNENNYSESDDSNETTIVVRYTLNESSVNEGDEHIYESFEHLEEKTIYTEITDNNIKDKSNRENKTDKHQKKQTKELNRTKNKICFFIGLFIGISLCTIYNVITYFYPIII